MVNKKETAEDLDFIGDNSMNILKIVALCAGVYVVYKGVKGVTNIFGGADSNNYELGSFSDVNTKNATITDEGAEIIASRLMSAMNLVGTHVDSIYSALNGLNKADFVKISKAFGDPRYNGFVKGYWPSPRTNLLGWLNSELSSEEFAKLKEIIPDVFIKN